MTLTNMRLLILEIHTSNQNMNANSMLKKRATAKT